MRPAIYVVEFPDQYGNPPALRDCPLDKFGVWSTPCGQAMPEPKQVADGFRIRLICAPRFAIESYLKRQPHAPW